MTRAAFAMSCLANPEKQLNRLARRAVHSPFVRNVVESLAGRVMVRFVLQFLQVSAGQSIGHDDAACLPDIPFELV